MPSEEFKFKKEFCDKYFGSKNWEQDVNKVDVVLKGRRGRILLYIEFKYILPQGAPREKALAQAVLTNWKQEQRLDHIAIAYRKPTDGQDVLEILDCSDDDVMYNNDINWRTETPSNPTADAVARINDRLKGNITTFEGDDIKQVYQSLRKDESAVIQITDRNITVVYNQWKNTIHFLHGVDDEQELINLFLTDILNGTKYKARVKADIITHDLFGEQKVGEHMVETQQPLLREGTDLNKYSIERTADKVRIVYDDLIIHQVVDTEAYDAFWRRYHRPPSYEEFLNILEHSARLYSEKYRSDTGGEYTPTCFVELQNKLLSQYGYRMDDYIVCDPCAGVGNLENQFGRDYKPYCYLSTLEQMDVDICKIKGFENTVVFNYLKNKQQPLWKYRGEMLDIREIARREGRKLMVIMNPPYTRKKGFKNDLAIEFFNKVLNLKPDAIVFYCKTEFLLRQTVQQFVQSGYHIVSHVFSNAKTTFKLSEWAVSQIIFDREKGDPLSGDAITAARYEVNPKSGQLDFIKTYTYDNKRPNLIKEIEEEIKANMDGMVLGQWVYLNSVIKISNGGKEKSNKITTHNLKWCLLSKGLNFNTHHNYFEWNYLVYRGTVSDIPAELFNDAVMFSQFYKGLLFTNKGQKNYLMPFKAEELGCSRNDLNVLSESTKKSQGDLWEGQDEPNKPETFDFRQFLSQFDFSAEAQTLYRAALEVFRYYHRNPKYPDKDWNDSYYDITNTIMGKDITTFKTLDTATDHRITRVKTTKGTRGFGRQSIKDRVQQKDLPLFIDFFDARDTLARKINQELLDAHLLLWKRENIY